MTIDIGDVVTTNYGERGVVTEEKPQPDAAWIAEQEDERVRQLGKSERWLGVLLFDGGFVLVPESLALRMWRADRDEFMQLLSNVGVHGARRLATVFPEYAMEIIKGRTED